MITFVENAKEADMEERSKTKREWLYCTVRFFVVIIIMNNNNNEKKIKNKIIWKLNLYIFLGINVCSISLYI